MYDRGEDLSANRWYNHGARWTPRARTASSVEQSCVDFDLGKPSP